MLPHDLVTAMLTPLFVAVGITILAFRRGRRSSPIPYFAAFATFFLFGPVLNLLRGEQIYAGTSEALVGRVAWWYVLALGGLLAADLLIVRIKVLPTHTSRGRCIPRALAAPLLLAAGTFAIFYALLVGIHSPSKRMALESASGFHYRFLVLEAVLASSYWFFHETRRFRKFYWYNLGSYVLYCLAFRERDFIFVLFGVLILGAVMGRFRTKWLLLGGLLAAILGGALFAQRARQDLSLTGILNQGSNLFVDTFLASLPSSTLAPIKSTYLHLVTGQPPTDFGGTGQWLKSLYAPLGSSGYGFSLVGEARFNVGLIGIFLVFMGIGVLLALSFSPSFFWDHRITGPAFVFVLCYALRSDMRSLAVGALYIVTTHALLARHERKKRSKTTPRSRFRAQEVPKPVEIPTRPSRPADHSIAVASLETNASSSRS